MQNPRLFLSPRERLIPRQNLRNGQLKSDIRQSLPAVNNYAQFEQKMKLLGYDIIKGRGIAFIDKKNVKIKGSEVGSSLQKIEKIMAMKQELAKQKILEITTENKSLSQARSDDHKIFSTRILLSFNNQKQIQSIALEKQIKELTGQLMKPEHTSEEMTAELFKKLRKKKRQRHHH